MIPTFATRATVVVVLLTLFAPGAVKAAPKSSSAFERQVDVLYSARSRRRIATYLRLKFLEMRKADLDRAALVVQHRLGVDSLFLPANPVPPRKDARQAKLPGQ